MMAGIARVLRENKRNILIALANIVCITIIVYIAILVLMPSDEIELERARVETRREIMDFTAYMFRNERVIYADFDIGMGLGAVYMVENGEKVARNQAIARLNHNHSMRYVGGMTAMTNTVRAEIESIESQIGILSRSNINLEHTPANIQSVNRDSDDLYIETLRNVRNGSLRAAGSHRDEKLVLMNKRQLMTGAVSNFSGMINELSGRKTELQSEFILSAAQADGGRNIYAERSGVFYRRADGFENYFTARAVQTLDLAAFEALTGRERDANIINRAIGKIAYDYRWYFVIRASRSELAGVNLVEGQRYDIICLYSSNRVIPFVFRSHITEHNSDDVLLVFETTIIPPDFYFLRRQTVQVVLGEISGIRVPDNAIVVRGVNRRWEQDANGEMREIVEIIENPEADLFADDEEIILGETVKGVYILHGREVRFRVLDDRDRLAEFDGYSIYAIPAQRVDGSTTTLLADEDIIVASRNFLYTGRIIN